MRTGLTVIAYITAKAGNQQQVRDALLDLVAHTRNERGCVNYDLHQSQENATEFAIYENWDKASDLDAHAKSAHVQEFTRIAGHLLERPAQIRKWIMVSELKRHEPVTLKSGFSGRLPGCGAGEWPSKGLFPDNGPVRRFAKGAKPW